MINYDDYPALLHTSFTKDDAPRELPFEVVSKSVRDYLAHCKGFNEMFALIAVKNTLKGENTNAHFYLDDNLFHKIDDDYGFRNDMFRKFFTEYIKPKNGVILFKNGGQYVYMLLGAQETKKLKKRDGRYIAAALIVGNFFVGFEEGYITDKGVKVERTGHYESDMPVGGYISFVLITLAFAGDDYNTLVSSETSEKIFKL